MRQIWRFTFHNIIIIKCVYDQFKKGTTKCPYEPRVCGIGFIGEGKYNFKDNKK